MKKFLEILNGPLVAYSLLAVVLVFLNATRLQQKETKRNNSNIQNDLIRREELYRDSLRESRQQIVALRFTSDSLNLSRQAILTELTKTRKELKSIRGRYKDVSVDSLANLMNRRASGK